jgi:hypothetical protein
MRGQLRASGVEPKPMKKEEYEQMDEAPLRAVSALVGYPKLNKKVAAKGTPGSEDERNKAAAGLKRDRSGLGRAAYTGTQHYDVRREDVEQIDEASADKAKELLAAKKERDAESQNYKFGSEKKETSARKVSGSSYGGSNQKPEVEVDDLETPKKRVRTITGATKRRYNTKAYESFSSIIDAYNKDGLKSLAEMLVIEEEHPDEKEDKALIKKMIKKSEVEDDKEDKALVKKMTKESVSEIVEYPLDVDAINNAGISAPIYNEAMEQTPSMSHRALYAQTYAKHGGTIGKAKAAGELGYRAVEKKHGKEASDSLRTYHTNNQNESFEIDESDLPTTNRPKEKVVVVRHKDSGKELHIVSHAVPEYQKRGYHPVTKGE